MSEPFHGKVSRVIEVNHTHTWRRVSDDDAIECAECKAQIHGMEIAASGGNLRIPPCKRPS